MPQKRMTQTDRATIQGRHAEFLHDTNAASLAAFGGVPRGYWAKIGRPSKSAPDGYTYHTCKRWVKRYEENGCQMVSNDRKRAGRPVSSAVKKRAIVRKLKSKNSSQRKVAAQHGVCQATVLRAAKSAGVKFWRSEKKTKNLDPHEMRSRLEACKDLVREYGGAHIVGSASDVC